ncbi:hypothetical protein ACGF7V_35770, partial [Streptomyces sp. NPDC047725]
MIALIRYTFATVLHTQRYLAPLLLFMGLMGVLTVNGSGPLPPAYASSAGALFVCSTWLTIALMSLDDPPQRAIVVITVGGRSLTVLLAAIGTALLRSHLIWLGKLSAVAGIVERLVPDELWELFQR